ncbi:MAG: DUF2520 domain-containing protein [bacterium]|nr:DUF2520 domain-containing protein [bacterium]
MAITTSEHRKKALDVNLLKPFIRETVEKALAQNPSTAQTGPVVRADSETMQNHIQQLEFNPRLQKLYRLISESIQYPKTGSEFDS